MRTLALIALAFPLAAWAAECGPVRQIHGNFAFDLDGQPDTRPYHWGTAESQVVPLKFTAPPAGKRIRILKISGELTARWTTKGQGRAWAPAGYFTGVLAAIMIHPSSRGSDYADLAADDHLAYVQADIGTTGVARAPYGPEFPIDVENAVLHTPESLAIEALRGGDMQGAQPHTLYFKFAKYLDETGLATHGEITWEVRFCYEGVQR